MRELVGCSCACSNKKPTNDACCGVCKQMQIPASSKTNHCQSLSIDHFQTLTTDQQSTIDLYSKTHFPGKYVHQRLTVIIALTHVCGASVNEYAFKDSVAVWACWVSDIVEDHLQECTSNVSGVSSRRINGSQKIIILHFHLTSLPTIVDVTCKVSRKSFDEL